MYKTGLLLASCIACIVREDKNSDREISQTFNMYEFSFRMDHFQKSKHREISYKPVHI